MNEYAKWPNNTNTLVKIYQACKDTDVLFLQKYLWDYKDSQERENRAQEIVLAVWETLNEPCD